MGEENIIGDRICIKCKTGVCGKDIDLINEVFVNLDGINIFLCKS